MLECCCQRAYEFQFCQVPIPRTERRTRIAVPSVRERLPLLEARNDEHTGKVIESRMITTMSGVHWFTDIRLETPIKNRVNMFMVIIRQRPMEEDVTQSTTRKQHSSALTTRGSAIAERPRCRVRYSFHQK